MGMEGRLRQVSEFELAAYRRNPSKFYLELINDVNTPDLKALGNALRDFQNSPMMQNVRERTESGQPPDQTEVAELRREIQALLRQHPEAKESLESLTGLSKDGTRLSLYKSWHCLHFLLTGHNAEMPDTPLGIAVMGGTEIPDHQRVMGYGPARYLNPEQVEQIAAALESFPIAERAAAFDSEAADKQQVYSPHHDPEELVHYFGLLRDFYRDTANKRNAIILWIE
jgi:Domain of unknown function (DUF1877)